MSDLLDLPKTEHIKAIVDRANEIIDRSKIVNMAQYAHGINSTRANIEWFLKRIIDNKLKNYKELNMLNESVMKLAGYLYTLENNL